MIENIPLDLVLDALSRGAHDVVAMMRDPLRVPPVLVKTVRKQSNPNASDSENLPSYFKLPENVVGVFEIWKVFLDNRRWWSEFAYVVVSADYVSKGYGRGTWRNVEYRGFYTTLEEAQNEIDGYLR